MASFRRWLALRLLQHELEEREASARKLAHEAYAARRQGRAGRAWWDGYAHAIKALRDEERSL